MSIEAFDLNLLLVLHTVLAEKSVARAARRLHVTPSAISNALARLRHVLGDPLVTRKGRGIVPTPRAVELAPAIERGLRELEAAVIATPFDPEACTRTFTLAIADAGQLTWLPKIAARMTQTMPRAHLRVVGIDSLVALGDLGSTEIDLHVGMRGRGVGLHFEPLHEERLVLVARSRRRLSRSSLEGLRHVAVDMVPTRPFRDALVAVYARAGIRRDVVMTVPTFVAAAAVVATTDLVTTLPFSLVRAHGARLGVQPLAGPIPSHSIELAMAWHDRTHADPAAIAFRTLVQRAFR